MHRIWLRSVYALGWSSSLWFQIPNSSLPYLRQVSTGGGPGQGLIGENVDRSSYKGVNRRECFRILLVSGSKFGSYAKMCFNVFLLSSWRKALFNHGEITPKVISSSKVSKIGQGVVIWICPSLSIAVQET